MTALQLNAELFREMSIITDDENLMKKAVKYLKELSAGRQTDPTLLTKDEFFARIDEAGEQIRRGEGKTFANGEEIYEIYPFE